MTPELEDRTGRMVGAAIEVHRTLGPGFLERVYENALAVELSRRGISFLRQLNFPICYQGVEVGEHVLDLLIDDQIVVELKAARRLEDIHFVILRSYLKAVDREHGLLLNFAGTSLEIKRVFLRTVEDSSRLSPGFLGSRVEPPA